MALNKDIYFLAKTDADWAIDNPLIPENALIFTKIEVDNVIVGIRAKYGNGSAYNDTPFLDSPEVDKKLNHPNGSSSQVIFADGSVGDVDTLNIQDILDVYHLLSTDEWSELYQYSIPEPTVTMTNTFSLADKLIGDSLSGSFQFLFTKTNIDSILDATGGNISVDQGVWSDDGDFDLKAVSSIVISGTNNNWPSATTVTFTITVKNVANKIVDTQKFTIDFKYPLYAGVHTSQNITDQNTLTSLLEAQSKTADNIEFAITGAGVQSYYHVLVPSAIAASLDIRFQDSPGYDSAGMILYETIDLTIGNVITEFNHYVSQALTAGNVNLLLRTT